MDLVKEHWSKQDIAEFEKYLLTLSKGKEKGEWEQRIINTQLPCIAVPSPAVNKIVKEIAKGNYQKFIDYWLWNNYTETAINGKLICKIKDFNLFAKYLTEYAERADNWATCDCLTFKINEKNKDHYFALAVDLIKSEKPFVKRVGLNIVMALLDWEEYLSRIFTIMNSFKDEENYYVNMMVAWLLSVCFVKHRDQTLQFLQTHNLNKFTINKAISKCHDSFRVSDADKEMLKSFRQSDVPAKI